MQTGASWETVREFRFTDADFNTVCRLLHGRVGIFLSSVKRELVYSRLVRRVRVLKKSNFSDYLEELQEPDSPEWQEFINALTTNLTSFFREPHHFSLLAEQVASIGEHPVTLWCAACSTGEEAYSMAIVMAELFGSLTPPVSILASDVDTAVIRKAQAGIYEVSQVNKIPDAQLRKYFLKGNGFPDGKVRVHPELAQMITFRQINLLDTIWPIHGGMDAIFCRNVMIYFDKETQLAILEKFSPLLRPEGLLYAGHSESFYHAAHLFKLRGKTVYTPVKK